MNMVGKYESCNVHKKALVSGLMDWSGGAAQVHTMSPTVMREKVMKWCQPRLASVI